MNLEDIEQKLTDELTVEIQKVYRVIDENAKIEGRPEVDLLQEIEHIMHQYRYHIMAVYDKNSHDDPDKLGKHDMFV